jgi:hypothetical protein
VRRSTRRIRIEHVAALIAGCVACAAQDATTVALSNGVQIQVSANFGHPTGTETLTVEMARASGNSFYRILWDQNHLAVFAYELGVDLGAGGDRLVVTAKPAENDFARRYPDADAGKPVPTLSSVHDLGSLGSGQSATLGLFEIPGAGLQVSETVRVKMGVAGGTAGPLHFGGIRVFLEKTVENKVEDDLVSGAVPRAAVSGRYAMFYLPDRGGYFFSTEPVTNRPFIEAGTVDQKSMEFTIDNETFRVTGDLPILGERGNVWVYHDPAYKPSGTWTLDLKNAVGVPVADKAFFTAASDTLTWWLR